MYYNHIFQNVNEALPRLLHELQAEGDEVGSRAGRTKELTHIGITLEKPWQREVLTLERKPSIAAQIAETMWVLSGRDDMEFLSHYLPRAKDFSDDGETWRAGYGKRLRSWPRRDGSGDVIDQLAYIVRTLKQHSTSRQAVMTLWDPQVDTAPGKDIPCNDWITFSNRLGKLDMHVALRSNDVIWGWSGINQFEWSAMLEVVAGLLGVQVGGLHFSTTSFHLYEHHWAKARKIVSASQNSAADVVKDSPRFDAAFVGQDLERFDEMCQHWFNIEAKIRNGVYVDGQVDSFPEPMLRSWLRVLQWWWSGQREYLAPLTGTALELATYRSVQPAMLGGRRLIENELAVVGGQPGVVSVPENGRGTSEFLQFAVRTHNEKHAAYGDSWKRRGEMLGIMANIARKIDRLGKGETSDETSADTAMDLMVYLAKYRSWLTDHADAPEAFVNWGFTPREISESTHYANALMMVVEDQVTESGLNLEEPRLQEFLEESLRHDFDQLEFLVTEKRDRYELVDIMLRDSYRLARLLWEASHKVQDPLAVLRGMGVRMTDAYQGADVD